MSRKLQFLFTLFFISGIALSAYAFNPKLYPGLNDKSGTITGTVEDGSEVKLPLGLPFQITDPSLVSSTSNEEGGTNSDSPAKIVYTFDLPDGQGPESYHETHSAFQQARSMNAACVLIRMNNMASALNAAENLSNEISDYDRPVMVYVNDKAISASQLISMATENKKDINHSKQTKHVSAQTKKRETTLSKNLNFRSGNYTDENSCTTPNSLLLKTQFSNQQNSNLDEVLFQAGLNNYTVVHYSPGFFAQIMDWCMKPIASMFFILLIAVGLRTQINSVFPGPSTFLLLVSLPLFGIPLFVGGLAGAGEFGLVVFFAALLISVKRNKTSSKFLQITVATLFIATLSFCQSESFATKGNWQVFLITFLISSATFLSGWYLTTFFKNSFRPIKIAIS